MKKNLGDKGKYISDEQINEINQLYNSDKENEFCKIYNNEFFGYRKISIEQPLIKNGEIQKNKKNDIKPDPNLRDTERIKINENIDDYFKNEIKPHFPNSWIDHSKEKIGYEINFTKYFYKLKPLRNLEQILEEIRLLDIDINNLTNETVNE